MKYKRLRPRNTRNPTKDIDVKWGLEGDRRDPFGYTEFKGLAIDGSGRRVTLHLGIGTWLKITTSTNSETLHERDFSEKVLTRRFERMVGTSVHNIERRERIIAMNTPDDNIYGGP